MKKATVLLAILLHTFTAFGQQTTPLSQADFVKMLYAVQKTPSIRVDIVDVLRKRGIAFELTDGIRGLVKSKVGNDDELKRALEEAGRRRANPEGRALPSISDSMAILERTRKNTLDAVGDMPDFVVKQQIQRAWAFANTNNFKNLDRLVVAVSFRSTGEEDYRVLSTNGIINTEPKTNRSYAEAGGFSSTGEFVTMLATVFKPESEGKFEAVDTDLIRERKAIVYDFSVTKDKARQGISTTVESVADSTITGMKGRIWIDRENARVLRVESQATDIPDTFPVRAARRVIDYDWVTIADEKYLLPSVSDVRLTSRESSQIIETRNIIRFKEYQKYGTDVVIRDDDVQPDKDPIKP